MLKYCISEKETRITQMLFTGIKTQRFLKYWGQDHMWFCLTESEYAFHWNIDVMEYHNDKKW